MTAILAGLYLQLGLAYAPGHAPPTPPYNAYLWDIADVRNPYGTVEMGWTHEWGKVSMDLAYRHMSSIPNGQDLGTNSAELRVRWRPWR